MIKNNKSVIRILHYIGSLNIGGSQSMILEIYRKIDKSKIQFDFIVDRKNEDFFEKEIKLLGGKIYYLNNINEINIFKYIKQWNDFFKKNSQYKIIHTHVRSTAAIVLSVAKKNGLKTISHSHSTSNGKGIKSIIKYIFQLPIRYISNYLFACSKDSARWLYGKKYSHSNKSYIINNAIDSKKYSFNKKNRNKIRKELNIDKDTLVIGQVGRLENVKNYNFSIEVINELIKENRNIKFLIIGEGSLKSSLIEKIKKYNLEDKVIFLGNVNNVNEILQAMDIYIMPSLFEGLSLALVEAQAASLPCIISKNIKSGLLIKDLIKQENLNYSVEEWKNLINNNKNIERKDRSKEIKLNGFDIIENVSELENFYLNLER